MSINVHSVEIIRLQIDYDNTEHTMDIELFDDIAPLTVANYLDYVTSTVDSTDPDGNPIPKYDGTFVYRNVPDFVLQMGGYTFRPPDPLVDALISPFVPNPVGLFQVVDGPLSPVVNEYNLSNTRGTIAMAKIAARYTTSSGETCTVPGTDCTLADGTGPDSATKEWFINLNDNVNLDTSNGGFTVFGRIIDDGINIADDISTYPDRRFAGQVLNPDFTNLPVVNYDNIELPAVLQEHLVMITAITANIERPILRYVPGSANFGLDVSNDGISAQKNILVKNTGSEALKISSVNTTSLLPPFTVDTENCSSVTTLNPVSIDPSSSCSINFSYSPTSLGKHTGEISIVYTNDSGAISYSATLNVSGEGVPQQPVLTTSVPAIVFENTSRNSASNEATLTIENKGGDPLDLSLIEITGIDSTDFTITTNVCIAALLIGETCDINIIFSPVLEGDKVAELSIQSNGGNLNIPLSGLATIPIISVDPSIQIKAQIGDSSSRFIFVTNNGTETLVLSDALFGGMNPGLFSQTNNCPDINNSGEPTQSLEPGETCRFLITFSPITDGDKTAILSIESNDPDTPSIDVALTGTIGKPVISVVSTFDVGTSQVSGHSSVKELTIENVGNTPLLITNILGLDATDFSQTNTCSDVDNRTAANSTCSIFIAFDTASPGVQTITITIESNDPASPSVNVILMGFGDNDSDGVPTSIESASPNSGDANNDSILDDVQNDVASLLASNSNYITFISDQAKALSFFIGGRIPTTLADMKLLGIVPSNKPDGATFNYGLYSYSVTFPRAGDVIKDVEIGSVIQDVTITEDTVGDGVDVAIILPPGTPPTKLYKFGPTPNNTTPHWYDFTYDTATLTGAQFFSDATFEGLPRNIVIISYVDGMRGDDDLENNGVILNDTVGLSFTPQKSSSGSSSTSIYLSFLILFIIYLFRNNFIVKKQ